MMAAKTLGVAFVLASVVLVPSAVGEPNPSVTVPHPLSLIGDVGNVTQSIGSPQSGVLGNMVNSTQDVALAVATGAVTVSEDCDGNPTGDECSQSVFAVATEPLNETLELINATTDLVNAMNSSLAIFGNETLERLLREGDVKENETEYAVRRNQELVSAVEKLVLAVLGPLKGICRDPGAVIDTEGNVDVGECGQGSQIYRARNEANNTYQGAKRIVNAVDLTGVCGASQTVLNFFLGSHVGRPWDLDCQNKPIKGQSITCVLGRDIEDAPAPCT